MLDETLVVVTADHGEHFGEQRLFGHGCSLYTPELHVPLLILPPQPRLLGDAVGRVVTHAGVAPRPRRDDRRCHRALHGEGAPFPGHSLLSDRLRPDSLRDRRRPPRPTRTRAISPVCRGPLSSLVDRGFHYIRNGDGREELYDLDTDPHETHDLARSAEATEMLRQFRESLPQASPERAIQPQLRHRSAKRH